MAIAIQLNLLFYLSRTKHISFVLVAFAILAGLQTPQPESFQQRLGLEDVGVEGFQDLVLQGQLQCCGGMQSYNEVSNGP